MADGVEQAARIQGDADHQREVHQAVDEQRHGAVAGQRGDAHFKGHGGGARRGEQRADGQVADGRQQQAGAAADRRTEGVDAAADARQRDDGDDRQTDGGDQEAQRRDPDVFTGLQADHRREDDVPGPNE